MKIISLFVVFFTIQSSVYSRTLEDVLNDFEPAFGELHSHINKMQEISHREGSNMIGILRQIIGSLSWSNQQALESALYDVRDTIRRILGENGMISHEDLVKHCLDKEQIDVQILIKETRAGTTICTSLVQKSIEKLEYILNNYYNEQSTWHNNVEEIKKQCSSSTTPYELQECLITFIYLIAKPEYGEKEMYMHEYLRNQTKLVEFQKPILEDCYTIVSQKTINDRFPIINDYEKCVIKAAENMN